MKYPNIFTLNNLIESININHANINNKWVPARPLGLPTFKSRLRLAWMVFTGKADVLIWPENQ